MQNVWNTLRQVRPADWICGAALAVAVIILLEIL